MVAPFPGSVIRDGEPNSMLYKSNIKYRCTAAKIANPTL